MSSFENALKSIIESAAKDFDDTIDRDPTVTSVEDGTARGDYLDSILAQQRVQRDQLWKQLHEVCVLFSFSQHGSDIWFILYSWKISIVNED